MQSDGRVCAACLLFELTRPAYAYASTLGWRAWLGTALFFQRGGTGTTTSNLVAMFFVATGIQRDGK